MPSYTELVPLLQSYETRLNFHSTDQTAYTTFFGHKNNSKPFNKGSKHPSNFSSKGKGFVPANQYSRKSDVPSSNPAAQNKPRESNRDLVCQVCDKQGHNALHCWHRFNHAIQPDNIPQAFAALHFNSGADNGEWTSDTSASAHMTSQGGILHNLRPYIGIDNVLIGNRDLLHITHVGDTTIGSGSSQITLHDVLLVPDLERNLLSIGPVTSDYLVNCEFSNHDFMKKDRATLKVLMKETKQGNLYSICASPTAFYSTRFQTTIEKQWHQRLEHPQAAVVSHFRKLGLIKVACNKEPATMCESCPLGKMSKLHFSLSISNSIVIFDKLHIDLWGPAPVLSIHRFKYYAAIVDDFTKFIWLIPLK